MEAFFLAINDYLILNSYLGIIYSGKTMCQAQKILFKRKEAAMEAAFPAMLLALALETGRKMFMAFDEAMNATTVLDWLASAVQTAFWTILTLALVAGAVFFTVWFFQL